LRESFSTADAEHPQIVSENGLLRVTFQDWREEDLTQLQFLSLSESRVTDAGLAHLKGMARLETLWLGGTQVTDAGLVHLRGLTSLTSAMLCRTQVTAAGVANLQHALPGAQIRSDNNDDR